MPGDRPIDLAGGERPWIECSVASKRPVARLIRRLPADGRGGRAYMWEIAAGDVGFLFRRRHTAVDRVAVRMPPEALDHCTAAGAPVGPRSTCGR